MQRDGMLSGNVCLLKRVCEIMSKQNSLNGNSTDAARTLLAVEILVNPSSVSLPAVSSMLAAKKFLTNNAGNASSRSSNSSNTVDGSTSNNTIIEEVIQITDFRKNSQETSTEAKTSGRAKRGREEVENSNEDEEENEGEESRNVGETGDKKRLKKDASIPFVVDTTHSAAFGKTNENRTTKEVENGNNDDDDDDDDSLPDIDIDANPEK